jgi:hypothetical protein
MVHNGSLPGREIPKFLTSSTPLLKKFATLCSPGSLLTSPSLFQSPSEHWDRHRGDRRGCRIGKPQPARRSRRRKERLCLPTPRFQFGTQDPALFQRWGDFVLTSDSIFGQARPVLFAPSRPTANGLPRKSIHHCGGPSDAPPSERADAAAIPIAPAPMHKRLRPICDSHQSRHSPDLARRPAFQLSDAAAPLEPLPPGRMRRMSRIPRKQFQSSVSLTSEIPFQRFVRLTAKQTRSDALGLHSAR